MQPKLSLGRFLNARRVVAYGLMIFFIGLPMLHVGGKPAILLDLPNREFSFFGSTFLPTDTLLLAFLFLILFISIFLVTALLGRVWCGWGCPQTVYMEFLYRPIERLFEGRNYRTGGKVPTHPLRRAGKYIIFFIVSLFLSNTFLAYFVGWGQLLEWITGSPLVHPKGFAIVAVVTALMMLDFCLLREQVCTLMCPYGRFQSALLDPQSLIISYDEARGEPRGRKKKTDGQPGDCIDCNLCVVTCPTGIDIREGLQMECIACTQCIDACDTVMEKIKKPRGLIRFTSQHALATGQRSILRPRVVVYPLLLLVLVSLFSITLARRGSADVTFLRNRAAPYTLLESGDVSSTILMKITNRTKEVRTYQVNLIGGGTIECQDLPVVVEKGNAGSITMHIVLPQSEFTQGRAEIIYRVTGDDGFDREYSQYILGPLFGDGANNTGRNDQ